MIQDLNIHIKALGFLREWNRIAFVLISDCSIKECNLFSTFCISGVVLPRTVVCSWGGQDQYSWCVNCQSECVSWRVQGHCFGGLCVVIWFDYLVDYPVVFWGLDVALGLRVNQYKLLVYLSLTFKLIYILFLVFTGINNRLFFHCFVVLLILFLANLIYVLDSYKEFC